MTAHSSGCSNCAKVTACLNRPRLLPFWRRSKHRDVTALCTLCPMPWFLFRRRCSWKSILDYCVIEHIATPSQSTPSLLYLLRRITRMELLCRHQKHSQLHFCTHSLSWWGGNKTSVGPATGSAPPFSGACVVLPRFLPSLLSRLESAENRCGIPEECSVELRNKDASDELPKWVSESLCFTAIRAALYK